MHIVKPSNLINKLSSVDVIRSEYLSPEIQLPSLHQATCLLLEHRIVIGNRYQLLVTETFSVSDVRQIRIALLAVLANNQGFIQLSAKLSKLL